MQEFLNPKSMMTPGIAGATMMFIVNGIVFAFPELQPRIIALILSFLIGSIVFASKSDLSAAIWTKSVYWIVNSLIIFVVGFGTANFAASNSGQAEANIKNGSLFPSLITSVYAQDVSEGTATAKQNPAKTTKPKQTELTKQLEAERKKNAELTEQLSKMQAVEKAKASEVSNEAGDDRRKQQKSQFFQQW